MPELELKGCRPEPLISFLKALGVLRLVSEQADPEARGYWRNGVFVLRSQLAEKGLTEFFLDRYEPTPMLAPWNGGCGLYVKWDYKKRRFKQREIVDSVNAFTQSTNPRLKEYRDEFRKVRDALEKLAEPVDLNQLLDGKTKKERNKILGSVFLFQHREQTFCLSTDRKDELLATVRADVLSDKGMLWLDAALVLTTGRKKNRLEAPVLGSGGNVGNSDFSGLLVQALSAVIPLSKDQGASQDASSLLGASLFDSITDEVPDLPVGQFDPGNAGGPNLGQGFIGRSFLNPWDYILMCEGALLMGGSITRRLSSSHDVGIFPFTVASSRVGHGTPGDENTRGEIWLPLWSRPARIQEVTLLLSEGRAEVGGKSASTGVGFARAVASLGVDRGIEEFARYEFQERLGQSFLATPLGRFEVRVRPDVDLLQDLDKRGWLERFRRACRATNPEPPERFPSALRRLDAAIFDYCRYGRTSRFATILRVLGQTERELALLAGKVGGMNLDPVPVLSRQWLAACDDGSPEYRIALALAGIGIQGKTARRAEEEESGRETGIGPLRCNMEPVEGGTWRYSWTEKGGSVVWSSGNFARNLLAVLQRRLMEANRSGSSDIPIDSPCSASVDDIALFLMGATDDRLVEEYLWGLILVDHGKHGLLRQPPRTEHRRLSRAYALLKLLFLPVRHALRSESDGETVRAEPSILALLRGGNVAGAYEIAARRLRASGFTPMPGPLSGRSRHRIEFTDRIDPMRLAAALLIPVEETQYLRGLVLRPSG